MAKSMIGGNGWGLFNECHPRDTHQPEGEIQRDDMAKVFVCDEAAQYAVAEQHAKMRAMLQRVSRYLGNTGHGTLPDAIKALLREVR